MPEEQAENKKILDQKKILKIAAPAVLAILFLAALGSAYYFYSKYQKAVNGGEQLPANEIKNLTDKIGKFMDLPDEEPTIATVTDKEKLSGQPFFAKAQDGDKVLIFTQAQKAILYRPGTGKIIEVMSLASAGQDNLSPTQDQNQTEPTPAESAQNSAPEEKKPEAEIPKVVKVAVYNGTNVKGLAVTLAGKISALSNVEIGDKTNATGTYKKTLVIDLTGNNAEKATEIAGVIGGETGQMPSGETAPEADILVIGGSQ
jgi:hypothetical protein